MSNFNIGNSQFTVDNSKGMRAPKLAADPAAGGWGATEDGLIYYNTTSNSYRIWTTATGWQDFGAGGSGASYWLAPVEDIQVDASLDPAPINDGDRYIITNTGALHANFGVIAGVTNGDVVEAYSGVFSVVTDVSLLNDGTSVYDIDSDSFYVCEAATWSEWGNSTTWAALTGGGTTALHNHYVYLLTPQFALNSFDETTAVQEYGDTVNNLDFNWDVNRDGTSSTGTLSGIFVDDSSNTPDTYIQTPFNDTASYTRALQNMDWNTAGNVDVGTKQYTYKRYTLSYVADDTSTGSRTTDIYWAWKTFHGTSASGQAVLQAYTTSAEFEALFGVAGTLRTSVYTNYTFNAANEYLYICVPQYFTIGKFYVGGFETTFNEYTTGGNINNGKGESCQYKIYRSLNLQNGAGIVVTTTA